ncbi:MAG: hypothetical protein IPP94_00775 [Ignavibacteria bacterium]|nr:hypothetical protein [Ignavibacteria bacterium]
MKRLLTICILSPLILLGACDNAHYPNDADYDITAPLPPVGIVSVSLDHAVELRWIENQEPDVAGYNIYASSTLRGRYDRIGTSRSASFIDDGARNGVTYYYAVTVYDYSGNESDLSRDVVYDTPRPEGRNVVLIDRVRDAQRGGYDFSEYRVVHYDTDLTDMYFEMSATNVPYLVVWDDSDIQDMGYTKNLDEISAAPEAGWSTTRDALAIKGHTYVVWTHDNHFAKVRITDISGTSIVFDWAYQVAAGNPELFTGKRHGSGTARARKSGDPHGAH